MKTRTDVINHLITTKGYRTYLEIGVQNAVNFNAVKRIEVKIGVDPNSEHALVRTTSDEFFERNTETFDVIFIDGLHTHEQSLRDFENALKFVNPGGCIVLHDMLPKGLQYTTMDWCGEAWKTGQIIASKYNVRTFSEDHGVMVVFPEDKRENQRYYYTEYPGLEKLKESVNAVDSIEEVIPENPPQIPENPGWEPTDDELKELYLEKFGKKPRGRFNRENIIKKLEE